MCSRLDENIKFFMELARVFEIFVNLIQNKSDWKSKLWNLKHF